MPPRWRCPDCPAVYAARLSECPRCRSTKGLVMALNECAGCTTAFAVGLARCPHCGSTDFTEQGADMPKITAHGGPTIAGAQVMGGAWSDGADEESAPATGGAVKDAPVVGEDGPGLESFPVKDGPRPDVSDLDAQQPGSGLPPALEGGEESSLGSSSETSTEKPPTTPEPKPPTRPKRARTTASRSKKAQTESLSAPGTDGGPAADTSAPDTADGESKA